MVNIVKVWERVSQLAKSGTSGIDNQDSFNSKAYAVNMELAELLAKFYEENQQVKDALSPFTITTPSPLTTDSSGKVAFPAGYLHLLAVDLVSGSNKYESKPININERGFIRNSSIRKRSTEKGRVGHSIKEGKLCMLPEQVMNIDVTYIKMPATPSILFNEVSDVDNDYLEPTSSVDFEYPENMFNLIVYLMLEKFGIEVKEDILFQFSQLGIQREAIDTTPKH